ncbi:hypothetical protein BDR06DRAFT_969946 [Suillus hirtellus]|nr:hypothetical protein BDR06DRAFT_969946 [Suillus hirtellus]
MVHKAICPSTSCTNNLIPPIIAVEQSVSSSEYVDDVNDGRLAFIRFKIGTSILVVPSTLSLVYFCKIAMTKAKVIALNPDIHLLMDLHTFVVTYTLLDAAVSTLMGHPKLIIHPVRWVTRGGPK